MPASAIAICTTRGGASGMTRAALRRGERPDQKRAFAADDDHAELRRQRRAQRRQDQRRRPRQRILPREPGAERALVHVEIEVERVLAEQRDENPEQHKRRRERQGGDDDIIRRRRQAGRAPLARRSKWGVRRSHDVAPITPSTR